MKIRTRSFGFIKFFPRKLFLLQPFFLFLGLVVWCIGLLLANDKLLFWNSKEWHIQPLYFAGHLFTVWMFVLPFTKLFNKALAEMEGTKEKFLSLQTTFLGPKGIFFGFLLSLPFQLLTLHGFYSGNYDKYFLESTESISPVDIYIVFIWSLEWFINGYIWFILIAFILLTISAVKPCTFIGEIEQILMRETYKPFLLLIVQGSTSCVFFCLMTSFYVWYSEGDIYDFIGLGLTVLLLVGGFTPPWIMLHNKLYGEIDKKANIFCDRLVLLDHQLSKNLIEHSPEVFSEEVALIHRVGFLDKFKLELGQKQGRSVVLRLLVPFGTMIWQFLKPFFLG